MAADGRSRSGRIKRITTRGTPSASTVAARLFQSSQKKLPKKSAVEVAKRPMSRSPARDARLDESLGGARSSGSRSTGRGGCSTNHAECCE